MSDIKLGKFEYSIEVEAYYKASPELLAQMKAGADQLQAQIEDVLSAFNGAVDRAGMLLLDNGAIGVVAWYEQTNTKVDLCIDDVPAVTITGEYVRDEDRLLFNVETTWHPPYEHLASSR